MRFNLFILTSFYFLSMFIPASHGSKMLFISAIGTKSHRNFFQEIINIMAENGHEMTVLTPYKSKEKHPNVREIITPNYDVSQHLLNVFNTSHLNVLIYMVEDMTKACLKSMKTKESRDLLNEKFDLVFIGSSWNVCYFSMVYHMQTPVIAVTTLHDRLAEDAMGLLDFPSFMPNLMMELERKDHHLLTFKSRLINFIYEWITHVTIPMHLEKFRELCIEEGLCEGVPLFIEIYRNFSFLISNTVPLLEYPLKPTLSNTLNVGGIHCRPAKPLPQDLENWLRGSEEHGFIYFSLGSWVRPSDMPDKFLNDFIKVFASLSQRVIWKWDDESRIKDLPSNILIRKWLPQQDILGDSRIRLFISHGGLLSTLEATYHKAPVLGMPLFVDQYANMNDVQRLGHGKVLYWSEFNAENLTTKIEEILNSKSMQEAVEKRSKIMKDIPMPLKDQVSYWVDYVIRHDGAKHLKPDVHNMSLIQLYNIDVWACLLTMLTISICGMITLLIWVCRKCTIKKRKTKIQ